MNTVLRLIAAVALAAALYAAARPLGPLPPLGPFLDPANGVWAVARRAELPRLERVALPGLTTPVDVAFDDRSVPHIFAATEEDAYRALGYVVARDRLFQLELQTRATAGRLSELLGPVVLSLDREQRALGLAASADRAFQNLSPESPAGRATAAYAEGVNGWIDHLTQADLPLEYRLLNARPMRWEPRYSLYLTRRMGWTLAYQTEDLRRRRVAELVGPAAADALFPANSPVQEPIQPGGGEYPRYDWRRIPAPNAASRVSGRVGGWAGREFGAEGGSALPGDGVGSNNWAVAPARSATGHALLAGDPHLDLSLPSIWYEAHLVVTGSERPADPPTRRPAPLDVYGVTIPGAPGTVIGFNRDVAWSMTNTDADALDYYAEAFDDLKQPTRYRLDGAWVPLESRVEVVRGRYDEVLATDTIYFTHRGPVIDPHGKPLSIRWTVLEAGGETAALLLAAGASSTPEWMERTRGFEAPAQNLLAADRQGNIAIRSTGRFPFRPGDGAGTRVRDGTTRRSDWLESWPVTKYPQAMNPRRGYLSSANQQPLDPRTDATYLGYDWTAPARALRINALLRADSSVTVEDIRRWQTDQGSESADLFVPYFLGVGTTGTTGTAGEAGKAGAAGRQVGGSTAPDSAAALLANWDRRYAKDSKVAVLFDLAMGRLAELTWDELEPPGAPGRRVATPRNVMLAELLRDPTNRWWDRRFTRDLVEQRDEILRLALTEALGDARQLYGDPAGDGWRWDHVQHANIYHLLRIPALSALDLPAPGGPATLSPSSGNGENGSSWRMVVELGKEVQAWGVYPGGQSGNPVSTRYRDRIPKWVAGELDTLRTPHGPDELGGHITSRLSLVPAGNR